MSNNQIVKLSTVVVLSIILLTFATAATYPGPYGKNSTGPQYSYGKPPADKGKPDKGDKTTDKGGGGKGHQKVKKQIQNVKITAEVDGSEVNNITEAAQAYSFTIQSGSFISKAKQLEGNLTESTDLVFAGKLAVSIGDGFTVTGISDDNAYQTVVATGSFTEKPLGNSGKTSIVGTLDSPLVLQETAIEDLS